MSHPPINPVDSRRAAPAEGAGPTRHSQVHAQLLHELIDASRDTLLDDWLRTAFESSGASAPHEERARRDLLSFLQELTLALRGAHSPGSSPLGEPQSSVGETGSAGKDPEGDIGSELDTELDTTAITRAYGSFHRVVLELAAGRGVEVSLAEHVVLALHVNAAIRRAVVATRRRHDAELHQVAHRLRNPLGSATMALTLLRSRVDLGDSARLGEMLERNLKRLEGLIEEAVSRDSGT